MPTKVEEFRVSFDQTSYTKDGQGIEEQFATFSVGEGQNGRFYVLTTKSWSFTEPEELSNLAQGYIKMCDSLL